MRPLPQITVLDDAPAAEPEGVVVTVEANEAKLLDEKAIPTESYDPLKDLVNYRKPPVTLLEDYISDSEVSDEEIFENKTKIEDTLKNFGIPIQRIKATVGPTVTLYEIVQAQGIKISKVQGLENDIAQSLKALGIRIIAPIPGKGTIGIEVPNRDKQVVSMYSAVRSLRFQESKAELPVVIGRTIQNENYVFDLAKMPHLLVAGATGQGKSVGLNAIITSLLYRKHPAQLKFVMIDPKMVEFSLYAKIERHFLAKMESEDDAIITDPKKAVYTLNSLCTEMDNRLELCKKAGARNIAEYNEKFTSRRLNPMNGHRYLPVYRGGGRRVCRPDNDGPRGRGTGHASGPEGPRHRHPPDHRHAASRREGHHGRHQGQLPGPHRLPRDADDRLAHDHRPAGGQSADRTRRHALLEGRRSDAYSVCAGRDPRGRAYRANTSPNSRVTRRLMRCPTIRPIGRRQLQHGQRGVLGAREIRLALCRDRPRRRVAEVRSRPR